MAGLSRQGGAGLSGECTTIKAGSAGLSRQGVQDCQGKECRTAKAVSACRTVKAVNAGLSRQGVQDCQGKVYRTVTGACCNHVGGS